MNDFNNNQDNQNYNGYNQNAQGYNGYEQNARYNDYGQNAQYNGYDQNAQYNGYNQYSQQGYNAYNNAQQAYQQYPQYQAPPAKKYEPLPIAAFACGIAAIFPGINFLCLVTFAAIALGIISLAKKCEPKWMAITGLAVASAVLVFEIIFGIFSLGTSCLI